jgi:hypothetical protein
MTGSEFQSLGQCGTSVLWLTLNPGAEKVAQRVRAKYGAAVQITIGFSTWNGTAARSPNCGDLLAATPLPEGLSLSLHLKSHKVDYGGDFSGSIKVHESGPGSFEMDTGQPLTAVITKPGSNRIVGEYSGGIAGTGYGPRIEPGQGYSIDVVGGTARCDGGRGSALPAGHYDAVVQVGPEASNHPVFLTLPVPIQVLARKN